MPAGQPGHTPGNAPSLPSMDRSPLAAPGRTSPHQNHLLDALPATDYERVASHTASPGGRPPHAWLDDGRSLFDLFHSEWTLLALGPDVPATAGFEDAARVLALKPACRPPAANGAADVLARVSGR